MYIYRLDITKAKIGWRGNFNRTWLAKSGIESLPMKNDNSLWRFRKRAAERATAHAIHKYHKRDNMSEYVVRY